jgi:hypothetical protein
VDQGVELLGACAAVDHAAKKTSRTFFVKLFVILCFTLFFLTMGMNEWVHLSEKPGGGVRQSGSFGTVEERSVMADVRQAVQTGAALAVAALAETGAAIQPAVQQTLTEAVNDYGPSVARKVLEHLTIRKENHLPKMKERAPTKAHQEIARKLGLVTRPPGGKAKTLANLSNLPSVSSDLGKEAVRRVHMPHELVATVYNNTGALPINRRAEYHINPANHPLFPWLHTIAAKYGFWKFENLEFRFVSTTPKTAKGSVAMCVYYDTEDHPPRKTADFMNTQTGGMAYIGDNLTLKADPALLMGGLCVKRCRGAATPYDMNLFDGGHFYIETWGGDDTAEAGWLTVSYDVVFWMPTPYLGVGSFRPQNRSYLSVSTLSVGPGLAQAAPCNLLISSRDITVDLDGTYTGESPSVGILVPTGMYHVELKVWYQDGSPTSSLPNYSVDVLPTTLNGCEIESIGGFYIEDGATGGVGTALDVRTASTFFVVSNIDDPDVATGYTNGERGFKFVFANNLGVSANFRAGICIIPA